MAAKETILMSGLIFNNERSFVDILKHAGISADYDSPDDSRSGVMPVYLRIEKPVDTSDEALMKKLHAELSAEFKSDRSRAKEHGSDQWDKTLRTPKQWIQMLGDDIKDGTTHAWTTIPEKITKALQAKGFDGIKDTGGKHGGDKHNVWIAFEPNQIKSVNAKDFDPNSPKLYKSIDRIAELLIKAQRHDYGQGRRQVLVDVHTQRGVHQRLQWVGTQAEQQQKPAVNIGRARADFNEALRNVADSLSFIEGITRIDTITQKTNYEATLADVKRNLDVIENSIKVMPDGSEKQSMIASRDRYLLRYKDRVKFYKSIFPTREAKEQLLDKLAEKYGVYANKQAEKPQMKSITSILKLAKSHDIVREMECCGLKICIENDTGDIRSGSDESGKNWTTVMRHPYGYIKGTMATDGDEMDCYVGPNQNADNVYVIIQTKPTGEFDENKVMIGFDSKHAAKTAFWNQYDCPEKYFGGIFEMSVDELKQALFDMRVTSLDEGILGSIRRKLMKSRATESHADFVKRITSGQKKSLKHFDLARKVKVIDDPLAKSERAERAKRLKDMADAIAARKKREC